mmetsp:Transcript_11589/g.33746  ORF Transcript_11589/g.33746 Transcript_11589/m.33746 type:complete len:100 (-) Transcript_11589:1773-2072(-)
MNKHRGAPMKAPRQVQRQRGIHSHPPPQTARHLDSDRQMERKCPLPTPSLTHDDRQTARESASKDLNYTPCAPHTGTGHTHHITSHHAAPGRITKRVSS